MGELEMEALIADRFRALHRTVRLEYQRTSKQVLAPHIQAIHDLAYGPQLRR